MRKSLENEIVILHLPLGQDIAFALNTFVLMFEQTSLIHIFLSHLAVAVIVVQAYIYISHNTHRDDENYSIQS